MRRGKSITAFKMELDKVIEELNFIVLGVSRGQTP